MSDWSEYSKLILAELERHNNLIEKIRDDISQIKGDIKLLNYKSGLWGAIGGTVPFAIAIMISFFTGK